MTRARFAGHGMTTNRQGAGLWQDQPAYVPRHSINCRADLVEWRQRSGSTSCGLPREGEIS